MSPELDKKLCKAYPRLYRQRSWDMRRTCMFWGFECQDGWYDVIDQASSDLELLNRELERPWWQRAIRRVLGLVGVLVWPDEFVEAEQVKEKFGELRMYLSGGGRFSEAAYKISCWACDVSSRTCEVCGGYGKMRPGGWIRCECDSCYGKRQKD